jgi:transitional endoplasmic reticulum ATPase
MNAPFATKNPAQPTKYQASTLADLPDLTPVQAVAYAELEKFWQVSPVVLLAGGTGLGKTTITERFAVEHGARTVTMAEVADVIAPLDGRYYDMVLAQWLRDALRDSDTLILDGVLRFLSETGGGNLEFHINIIIELLYRDAEALGRKLIVTGATHPDRTSHHIFKRADLPLVEIEAFTHEDYAAILTGKLGDERVGGLNVAQIFRFASLLNGHDLSAIGGVLADNPAPANADVIEAIETFIVSANTRTAEVEEVQFGTMPGMEAIAEALETHVVLPLTDQELAEALDLKAKRGVLLYGPPGTGKTSVGRALAHKLKGRFFLIDGSVKTEPAYAFLGKVQAIVHEAIENAPSVIFIDDADVLFDIAHAGGLTRYLLTLMDGLAGVNASKVCVMMTAMDAGKIPQAILRSGRVELWLQTKLPNASTRAGILERWLGKHIPAFADIDTVRLGERTDKFTPADLRRAVADAKALYASDLVHSRTIASGTAYIDQAIDEMIASRNAMATNLADPSLRVG